jgi:hypothetical protein
MKNKLNFYLIMMALMSGAILVYGSIPYEDPKKTDTVEANWQGSSCGIKKMHMSDVEADLKLNADASKEFGGSINLNATFALIVCCGVCPEENSWCNYKADDERCNTD